MKTHLLDGGQADCNITMDFVIYYNVTSFFHTYFLFISNLAAKDSRSRLKPRSRTNPISHVKVSDLRNIFLTEVLFTLSVATVAVDLYSVKDCIKKDQERKSYGKLL